MIAHSQTATRSRPRTLSKVPEITLWFWVIKILCTTVGESFADFINLALGVGLLPTAFIFTIISVGVLSFQVVLHRYHPGTYWLAVVLASITGTLYTDLLTDEAGVPLWVSSLVFSLTLAIVFLIWYTKEKSLSIHSITTPAREVFYWLTVLVTFALGTALGDWTLELTGWGPGLSVLLPFILIGIIATLWKFGANPILAFWIAYVLTRPLGANIGDWLALTPEEGGLGIGTLGTSLIFLTAILTTVIYLTISKQDTPERATATANPPVSPTRQRLSLRILTLVGIGTITLLTYTNALPHTSTLTDESPTQSCTTTSTPLTQTQAQTQAQKHFPAATLEDFRTIAADTLTLVKSGDQPSAANRITNLETAWDENQTALNTADCAAWTYIDQQIDPVLTAVRSHAPVQATEEATLTNLIQTLDGH